MFKVDKELMYKEVILEHSRWPLNFGTKKGLEVYEAYNQFCGDKVNLQFDFEKNGRIKNVYHSTKGCAISVASASILTEVLQDKTVKQAMFLSENFIKMASGQNFDENLDFAEGVVFENIKNYPARLNCAIMAWQLAFDVLKKLDEGK